MPSADLTEQILQLSECMRRKPSEVESKLLIGGARSLSIVCGGDFDTKTPEYKTSMHGLYKEVINDLAHGAPLLTHHTLGISSKNQRLVRFSLPVSDSDILTAKKSESLGTLVCTIELKIEAESLTQDDVNAAIYLIAYYISQL